MMVGPVWLGVFGNINLSADWCAADRASAGIAPDPASPKEAVVQTYTARAFNGRGVTAVQTWVATTPEAALAEPPGQARARTVAVIRTSTLSILSPGQGRTRPNP